MIEENCGAGAINFQLVTYNYYCNSGNIYNENHKESFLPSVTTKLILQFRKLFKINK